MRRTRTLVALALTVACWIGPHDALAAPKDAAYDNGTGAAYAWQAGFTGWGSIAMVGSGTQATVPWFTTKGRVIGEACFSTADPPRLLPLCPAQTPGGGLVEGPVIAMGAAAPPRPAWGVGADEWPNSLYNGTLLTGIAAGARQGGFGKLRERGLAPDANIVAVNVYHLNNDRPRSPSIDPVTLASALGWVDQVRQLYNITVVHLDVGALGDGAVLDRHCDASKTGQTASLLWPVRAAIDRLIRDGVVVVIGAFERNGIALTFPDCLSTVISVGSLDRDGHDTAQFSSKSAAISVFARGDQIAAPNLDGGVTNALGTGPSAALVAGAVSLYKQKYPNASVSAVRAAIKTSGEPVYLKLRNRKNTRWGRKLDVARMLDVDPLRSLGTTRSRCFAPRFSGSGSLRTASVRLRCAPSDNRPGRLLVGVTGPGRSGTEKFFDDIPIGPEQFYIDTDVGFTLPRIRVKAGEYTVRWALFSSRDKEWPDLTGAKKFRVTEKSLKGS